MHFTDFHPYTRHEPVAAVQLQPGMEDDWIAVDAVGNILSTARNEASVRQAAPQAARYAPTVHLPGLDNWPLAYGDYILRHRSDQYLVMSATAFEQQHDAVELEGKSMAAAPRVEPVAPIGDKPQVAAFADGTVRVVPPGQ